MANAKPKKRPMRSKRSGIKKLELVKANLSVLKRLAALFIIMLFAACVTPSKVIETTTTDSTGKTVKTVQKIYDNHSYSYVPQASINVMSSPLLWNYPHYIPQPRVIVPINPRYTPSRIPRRGRH